MKDIWINIRDETLYMNVNIYIFYKGGIVSK